MPFNPLSWFTSTPTPAPAPATAPPPAPPPAPTPTLETSTPAPAPAPATPRPTDAQRHLKQLTLLLSGSTFLALSILTTRRSLTKRRLALTPPFYHPNTRPPLVPPNGALDAVEALNLATLNTTAFAMFLVGGAMVALDVSSVDELRARARATALAEGEREKQRAAEEEFEEWLVGVLARKERKEEVKRRVREELERERAAAAAAEGGGG